MKISVEKYAQTLQELTEGKSREEAKKIVADFFRILTANNDLPKAEKIIEAYKIISDKVDGVISAKVSSAIELEKDAVDCVTKYIKRKTGAEKIRIEKEIDKKLLGGTVIEYGDKILDLSLKTRIRELKNKMSK